jgi:hypothetical protein
MESMSAADGPSWRPAYPAWRGVAPAGSVLEVGQQLHAA